MIILNTFREDEYAVVFWKETLNEYFSVVAQSLTVKKSDILKTFILHNRKPTGLSNIMVILDLLNKLL